MKKKIRKLCKTGLGLLLATSLVLSGVSLPTLTVCAATPTSNEGPQTVPDESYSSSSDAGAASGVPTNDAITTSELCVMFTFWEPDSSGHPVLKYGILQSINSINSTYYNGNGGMLASSQGQAGFTMTASSQAMFKQYLNGICNTTGPNSVTIPDSDVGWKVYGREALGFETYVSNNNCKCHYTGISKVSAFSFGFSSTTNMDTGVLGAHKYTASQCFEKTMSQLGADKAVLSNIMNKYAELTGSACDLESGSVILGVSECVVALNKIDDSTAILKGIAFPDQFNSMGVQETTTKIFRQGENACFTYIVDGDFTNEDAPAPTEDIIHTYDVVTDPKKPAEAEKPDTPEKQGEFVINKVYVDMNGADSGTYCRNIKNCKGVVISDEKDKLSADWAFQGWQTSPIGASHFEDSDYSGFTNLRFETGYYDMTTDPSGNKQLNLLFVKQFHPAGGSIIISEQSLGVGVANTYTFAQLQGSDVVGYDKSSDTCGYKESSSSSSCGADCYDYAGVTYTHEVTYSNPGSFFTLINTVAPSDGLLSGTTGSQGQWFWKTSASSSTHNSYHTSSGKDHDPDPSGVTALQNAPLQVNNIVLYRHNGLGDDVKPLYTNSAYTYTTGSNGLNSYASPTSSGFVSSAYENALASVNHRKTAGGTWVQIGTGNYGSLGYMVGIPKVLGTDIIDNYNNGGANTKAEQSKLVVDDATFLNNIIVYSYRAHPNITPAEYGHRPEYDVDVTPIVVMHLPYAQSNDSTAVDSASYSSTDHNNDKSASVLVAGEYARTLKLNSTIRLSWTGSGIENVIPNTILNDAKVSDYLMDDLGWSDTTAPLPIPGGSALMIGETNDEGIEANTAGKVRIDISTPFVPTSPLEHQLKNNGETFFANTNSAFNSSAQFQNVMDTAVRWVRRYEGKSVGDVSGYTGAQCINDYIDECVEKLSTVYLALYVSDTVDSDGYTLEDMYLYKRKDADTPMGAIKSNGTFNMLNNGAVRTAHDDEKYSFGGIDGRAYLRVIKDPYPSTNVSIVGQDTAGGSYAFGSTTTHWDSKYLKSWEPATQAEAMTRLLSSVAASLGEDSLDGVIIELYKLDGNSDMDTIRKSYQAAVAFSLVSTGYAITMNTIRDSYVSQTPMIEQAEKNHVSLSYYYTDGAFKSYNAGDSFSVADYTLPYRAKQLSESTEHDVGMDKTWFKAGDWYNEGILPYYSIYTQEMLYLYFPANASTIVDTSLMGYSESKDDIYAADDMAWNGALVGYAFDGMTSSEFADNISITLPAWGSGDTHVELRSFGTSNPLAISNTDVSDLY